MDHFARTRRIVAHAVVAGVLTATPAFALPRMADQLVRCSSTPWATAGTCGGDPITLGSTVSIASGGQVAVNVRGAWSFNLYEVYWLPIGGTTADLVAIGNFATNCAGDARGVLRTITTPAGVRAGAVADIDTAVGTVSAGNFFVFSRGPWATDSDGDCRIDQFNTVPLGMDPTKPLANPVTTPVSDPVQFLSGYES